MHPHEYILFLWRNFPALDRETIAERTRQSIDTVNRVISNWQMETYEADMTTLGYSMEGIETEQQLNELR